MHPAHQPTPHPDDEQAYSDAHDAAPDLPIGMTLAHGDLFDVEEEVYTDPLDFYDEHLAKLGLTLDFGPADLAANQAGILSEHQLEHLERDLRWMYWPPTGVFAALTVVFGIVSVTTGTTRTVLPMILMMGLALISAVLLHLERARLPQQPVKRTMLRIGGFSLLARRLGFLDDASADENIKLPAEGGKPVFAPKHVYKVLKSGQTYIVYYAPVRTWAGYRALSIEPADEGQKGSVRKSKSKGKRR